MIPLCAALTAKRDSDARKAITLLHDAAETTEIRGLPEITGDIVRECERTMRQELEVMEITKLPLQLKLTLASSIYGIHKSPSSKPTIAELYNTYIKICKAVSAEPFKRRTFIEMLQELELQSYIDITKTSGGRGKGIQNIISSTTDLYEIKDQLLKDEMLSELKEIFNPMNKYE